MTVSKTGLHEFDRVLGGGLTTGSLVLLSGEPGVGKSSLILEYIRHTQRQKILYISGEESESQLAIRIKRFNIENEDLLICYENIWENIESHINNIKPDVIILDSIQTISLLDFSKLSGGSAQIKEVTNKIMQKIKKISTTCIVVGHITKDGEVAGPKVLEHMVDVVLTFKKDDSGLRVLKAKKNRFGTTSEIGLFEMHENGLSEYINKSEDLYQSDTYGIAYTTINDGSREHLVGAESLIIENRFGQGKRVALNFEMKRLNMLLAIIKKYFDIDMESFDIYLNISGNFKDNFKAMDLAIMTSLLSSYYKKSVPEKILFYGEIDLLGRVKANLKYDVNNKQESLSSFKISSNLQSSSAKDDLHKKYIQIQSIKDLDKKIFKAS